MNTILTRVIILTFLSIIFSHFSPAQQCKDRLKNDGYYYTYHISNMKGDTLYFWKYKKDTYYKGVGLLTEKLLNGRYIIEGKSEGCKITGYHKKVLRSGLWTYINCQYSDLPFKLTNPNSGTSFKSINFQLKNIFQHQVHINFDRNIDEASITAYDTSGKVILKGYGTIIKGDIYPHSEWIGINNNDTIRGFLGEKTPSWKTCVSIQKGDNNKFGLISKKGTQITNFEFGKIIRKESLRGYIVGDSITENDVHVGFLNECGEKVIPRNYQIVGFGHEALFFYSKKKNEIKMLKIGQSQQYEIETFKNITHFERREYSLNIFQLGQNNEPSIAIYNKNGKETLFWTTKENYEFFLKHHRKGSLQKFSLDNNVY